MYISLGCAATGTVKVVAIVEVVMLMVSRRSYYS